MNSLKEYIAYLHSYADLAISIVSTLSLKTELTELFSLLTDFQHELFIKRRSIGVLCFKDVVEMAVVVLKENTALRKY